MDEVIIVEYSHLTKDVIWNKLKEILRPAVERNETLNIEDVYDLTAKGLARVFAAIKDGKIFAAFMVEKVKGIRRSYLRVVLAAGEPMKEWINPFIKLMNELSLLENVEFYEMIGRPGWKRALKDIGYESEMIYRIRL